MTDQPKLNAEQICHWAIDSITRYMVPAYDACTLSQDESGGYFVFEFTRNRFGEKKSERFTVLAELIEDGIISQRELLAGLWHTLGRIEGMV